MYLIIPTLQEMLTLAGAKTVQSEVRGRSRHVDSQAVVQLCSYAVMVPSHSACKSSTHKQLCSSLPWRLDLGLSALFIFLRHWREEEDEKRNLRL